MLKTPLINHGEVYATKLFDKNKLVELRNKFKILKEFVPNANDINGKLDVLKISIEDLKNKIDTFLVNVSDYRSKDGVKSVYEETFDDYINNRITDMSEIIPNGKDITTLYSELIDNANTFIKNASSNLNTDNFKRFYDDEFEEWFEGTKEIIYELQTSIISEPGMPSDAAIRWNGGFFNTDNDVSTVIASFEEDSLRRNKTDFVGTDSSKIFGIESEQYDIVLYSKDKGMVFFTTDGVSKNSIRNDEGNDHPAYDYYIRHNDEYKGIVSEVKSFHPEPLQRLSDLKLSDGSKSKIATIDKDGNTTVSEEFDEYYSNIKPSLLLSINDKNNINEKRFIAIKEHSSHSSLGPSESYIFNIKRNTEDSKFDKYNHIEEMNKQYVKNNRLVQDSSYDTISDLPDYISDETSGSTDSNELRMLPDIDKLDINVDNPILQKNNDKNLKLLNEGNKLSLKSKYKEFKQNVENVDQFLTLASNLKSNDYSIRNSVVLNFEELEHVPRITTLTKIRVDDTDKNIGLNKYNEIIMGYRWIEDFNIIELDNESSRLSADILSQNNKFDLFQNLMIRIYPSHIKSNSSESSSLKSGPNDYRKTELINLFSGLLLKSRIFQDFIECSLLQVSTHVDYMDWKFRNKLCQNNLMGVAPNRKYFNINNPLGRMNDTGILFKDNIDMYKNVYDLSNLRKNYDLDVNYDIKSTFHLNGKIHEYDSAYFSNIPFSTQYFPLFYKYFRNNNFDGEFNYAILEMSFDNESGNDYNYFMNPIKLLSKNFFLGSNNDDRKFLRVESVLTSNTIKLPPQLDSNMDKNVHKVSDMILYSDNEGDNTV